MITVAPEVSNSTNSLKLDLENLMPEQTALEIKNLDLFNSLREEGLLSVPAAGNIVRFLPPLNINHSHIKRALEILEKSRPSNLGLASRISGITPAAISILRIHLHTQQAA